MARSAVFFQLAVLYFSTKSAEATDFYSFSVKDINGEDFSLEQYRGKVSLVVNVASECGYTNSHYKALTTLHEELSATGKFQVLAFPCNQFGAQEPAGNQDILKFAHKNYGVSFPIFSKIDVIGDNANIAFSSLIGQSGHAPTWNFWKYLVNADGKVIGDWGPQQSVESIADIVRSEVAIVGHSGIIPFAMAQIKTELVDYKDEKTGKVFQAFVARDASKNGRLPVVLVFHAFAGRREHENEQARKLAELGYVGFAADLYGKGVLGSSFEENRKLMQPFTDDRNGHLLQHLKVTLEAATKLPYVDAKKVAAIGYCFGGLCALDLARNGLNVSGVVSFHGVLTIPPSPSSTAKITAKVLVLHGQDDPYVPPEQVSEFVKEMTERGADWQLHAYGGVEHSFTFPGAKGDMKGVKYDPNAARRSWEAMRYFLNECLS